MNPASAPPCQILLAYPDSRISDYLRELLASGGYPFQTWEARDLNQLYELAAGLDNEANTLLFTDLIWDGSHCGEVLLSLSMSYKNLAVAIVSQHELASILPPFYPLPAIQGFEDAAAILKLTGSLFEDLRGQSVGAYQLQAFRGQAHLARSYAAYQPAIRREVFLNLQSTNASAEERALFRQLGRAQAGNIHPNIYSIYEEGEHQGRFFLTQEPVNSPTLFQLSLQDFTFDTRLMARVLHTACVTLGHLHKNRIAHPLIASAHITLSGEGVIKMVNTALPPGNPMPSEADDLAALARALAPFMPPDEPEESALRTLLAQLQNGEANLTAALAQSQSIDLALAPEKFVPQRQETIKAQAEVQKARKTSTYALYGFSAGLTCLTLFIIWRVLFGVVLEEPAIDFQGQLRIPAGSITGAGGRTIEVKEFYIDEFEVTLGQYEKFVLATKGQDIRGLLPPGWTVTKETFEPDDWRGILKSIKNRTFYERVGERLTRNHPVFNIDYADAYAFAKWSGKRLPTEAEWVRASSGNGNFRFPWGEEVEQKFTNTGVDMNGNKAKQISPAGVDGFRGPSRVNEFKKDIRDVSPFGVRYMAGNVSEWVETTPEISNNTKAGMAYVRGGNFGTSALVPNSIRVPQNPEVRQAYLGLRCASDQPVGKVLNPP
ncbi:MAG: SUMF1/EgtB/PvdO family nonheme iron enzyme [Bacteroidia bacterium]|nr:SUMF1/EgtB/PvdO family nonheme iron enzyme [Bacteroidia bacterium]